MAGGLTAMVVVCVPKLGSIIVRCDKAFVLMHTTFELYDRS